MNPAETESPAERHFMGLATRPLADRPEIHEEAQAELRGRMASFAMEGEERGDTAVAAAAARLEQVRPQRWWPVALAAGAVLLALAGVAWRQWQGFKLPQDYAAQVDRAVKDFGSKMGSSPQETLERLRQLHEASPDDPAVFEEYALFHFLLQSELPPDYGKTCQRIDPGNGIWDYYDAAVEAFSSRKAAGEDGHSKVDTATGMLLLEQALTSPRFHSYRLERRTRLLEGIRAPETYIERRFLAETISPLANAPDPLEDALNGSICDLLDEHAARLKETMDQQGMRALMSTTERLCLRLARDAASQADTSGARAIAGVAGGIASAAGEIGMTREQALMERRFEFYDSGYVLANAPYKSLLLGGVPENSDDRVPVALFEPSRRAEISFAERMVTHWGAAMFFLIAAGAGLESLRRGRKVNGLAAGLAPLFRPADHVLIAGAGVLAPLFWFLLISRGTPFGCLDISVATFVAPPHQTQQLATLLLVPVLLIQLGKLGLTRRCDFLKLGWGRRDEWIGWGIVVFTVALVPLAGFVREFPEPEREGFLKWAAYACGVPLLWLLWQAGATVFSPRATSLGGVLLCRLILWPLVAATALALLGHGLATRAERQWLAQDELGRWVNERGGITGLEARTVARFVAAHEKALGQPEKPVPPPAKR